MKYFITAVIVLTATVYSNMAFAWEANKPYIEASVGQFNYDGVTSAYIGGIFYEVDDDTIALDANVGFPFNDNVAIEGGFSYLTEADWSASAGGATINGTVDGYALTAATVLRLPISNNFGFFGKLGAYMWEVEATVNVLGTEISADEDGTDVLAGVGADFRINESISFVAGYDHYNDAGSFVHVGVRFTPQTMR